MFGQSNVIKIGTGHISPIIDLGIYPSDFKMQDLEPTLWAETKANNAAK